MILTADALWTWMADGHGAAEIEPIVPVARVSAVDLTRLLTQTRVPHRDAAQVATDLQALGVAIVPVGPAEAVRTAELAGRDVPAGVVPGLAIADPGDVVVDIVSGEVVTWRVAGDGGVARSSR